MSLKLLYALPLATLMLAGSAHAYDPIVQTRGWKQVAYDKDQGCEGEVRGNGQIYYIYAVGLGASTQGRYHLTNVDMEPIDWNITADDNGEWARYYIPFHYNLEYAADQPRYSGTVRITLATVQCSLNLAFDWRVGGYTVIEPDGTSHIANDDDFGQSVSRGR